METVRAGRSGLNVSRICLGTMIFGTQLDEAAAGAVLDQAADLGIDFVDLADNYPVPPAPESAGRTEEIVGRWLRSRDAPFTVATKCVNPMGPGVNDRGAGRKHVIEACDASLRRLGRECVDVFYLHHSDPQTPIDESLEALDRLRQTGKIHYVGLSNFEAWELALAMAVVAERRLARVSILQPRYNLVTRGPERDLLPLCLAAGIAVVPFNPLAAGVLAGRHERSAAAPGDSRFGWGDYGRMYQERYWHEAMFDVVDDVKAVAVEIGATPAQVSLAWLLAQPAVTAPIVGASRPEQLRDSVGALEVRLEKEHLDRLERVSQPFA
ncbi:MAG: aldo/keto reductase [Candidatus Dormibacteraeota bacterium]|nr:aldo/keto reductase [Candidatus Dormibacteraeota bacterium]